MIELLKKYLLLGFFVGLLPQLVFGQIDDDYFTADRLLQQQKYEEAAEKFYDLHQEHPATYIFLNKLTEALINLKEYDRAISVTEKAIENGHLQAQGFIRLGEIYHTAGDPEKAASTWEQVLDKYSGSGQIYLKVARAMKERRAYEQSIEVYKKARQLSPSSNIITTELAGVYMQAGKYEQSIREYLQLVNEDPERMSFVQRRLMRFQDDNIYDVAILEISDFLDDVPFSHPSYRNLQELEIWLLMERKLFKRALVTAKDYENRSSQVTYSLYNLGSQLLAEQQFELAEEAYTYYIEEGIAMLNTRSREELGNVYIKWAEYFEDYNLDLSSTREELYQKAFSTLETLRKESPNYSRMDQVLVMLSELALDVFHEPERAAEYLDELSRISDSPQKIAQEAYIQGRLYLYKEDYTRARMSFSKSNKQERIGNLAQKTRYYMALTDFFAGDFEFAKIQLNALERQNTSYFANNAVQLRLWIQSGLQADSSGTTLEPFSKAVEHFSQGEDQLGINILRTLFEKDRYNPLIDEALLELSANKNTENALFVYQALSTYLKQQGQFSPLYERLLWEKARLADQFVTNEEADLLFSQESESDSLLTTEEQFSTGTMVIPNDIEQLVPLYEDILLNFPNGFYATYARERIEELQQIQT